MAGHCFNSTGIPAGGSISGMAKTSYGSASRMIVYGLVTDPKEVELDSLDVVWNSADWFGDAGGATPESFSYVNTTKAYDSIFTVIW